ncbi:MAG: hypothetical protein OXD50_06975 [Chloroflexi bacterium]|nr:hypothetical protein [Chloroflexota bacterium]
MSDRRSLNKQVVPPLWPEELVGWLLLLSVVLAATHAFGVYLAAYGANDLLEWLPHAPAGDAGIHSLVAVIEVALMPLTALVAAWTRFGAERIRGLRDTGIGPWLPLIMAISIIGLATYMWWTLVSPQPGSRSDGFGLPRWFGAALAVAFTVIWLPLFPRVTSILAGMIAGPIVVALFGYIFYGSVFADHGSKLCNHESCGIEALIATIFAAQLGFFVLVRHKLSLLWIASVGGTLTFALATNSEGVGLLSLVLLFVWVPIGLALVGQLKARPALCFVVSALVAGGLAVSGARF